MNLGDLKENLRERLKTLGEQIQESDLFIQLKERYENLSPSMQKISRIAVIGLLLLVILLPPIDQISTSAAYKEEFQIKRELIRELLKVSRDAAQIPNIPPAPASSILEGRIKRDLESLRLLPEQIVGVSSAKEDSRLIPTSLNGGTISVQLAKLNLRQIVDVGHKLASLGLAIKMKDMLMQPSSLDGYFDVTFKLVALSAPQTEAPQEGASKPPPRGRR